MVWLRGPVGGHQEEAFLLAGAGRGGKVVGETLILEAEKRWITRTKGGLIVCISAGKKETEVGGGQG